MLRGAVFCAVLTLSALPTTAVEPGPDEDRLVLEARLAPAGRLFLYQG